MKTLIRALAATVAVTFAATAALAEDKAPTKQQTKFGACSKEAKVKGLKGDERRAFMKTCAKKAKAEEKK
jgi:hypothetical protein